MEADLERVVEHLAAKRWPFRLHATYDESITRARSIERIKALGGGIAIQHRMAYQGEYFAERYGPAAAEQTPPIRRILAAGIPVAAGTDATRVASYNPWISLHWLITGKTVGGLRLYPPQNRLTREEALRLWTDFFAVPEDDIPSLTSELTVLGGRIVHAAGAFKHLDPPMPPASPDWSPVRRYGGYRHRSVPLMRSTLRCNPSDADSFWSSSECACWI